jgi:replicative DNA helicase
MTSIEQSIFKALLYSEEFVRRTLPYLEPEYFDGTHRTLFNIYKKLFDQYNSVPTFEAIAVTLQKESIGESEFDEIAEIISECYETKDDMPNVDWLVDETEQYCRDKKIYNAIYESINIIEGTNKNLDKHAIPDLLDDALAVSFDSTIGMEFFDDAEKRYDSYTAEDNRVKFPLDALNILSNNGHKKKALSCILAGTNTGKSSMMCYLSGEFLKQGLNVLYISLEMDEESLMQRVEANLLGVSTDELSRIGKERYMDGITKVKNKTHGRFFAKEYPTSSAHTGHFRHLIKELRQKKKFIPDFIFIDYLNICASSRYKSMSGVNSYSYVKAIAEELRGLAVEFDVPIMTATQVNRGGYDDQSPDMTSTSESFGVPATLDWFIAITQDEVLKENGQQCIHLLKTRWGNKSTVKPQLVNIDWDRMRYSDVGSTQEIANQVGQRKPKKKVDEIEWE